MPYKNTSQLPAKIRDFLTTKGKTVFVKAFNSAFKEYKNEKTAFKVAWKAAQQWKK